MGQHRDKLFWMFKRLPDPVPGTGPGLYFIHRIRQHPGRPVAVDGNPGAGSTFRIYFQQAEKPIALPA
jgi:light-regulated signal transduction histidine kinase (bacteriophytochrome)